MREWRWMLVAAALLCGLLAGAQTRDGGWPLAPLTQARLAGVAHPAAIVRDGKVVLLYVDGAARLAMAVSEDGLHFRPVAGPVSVSFGEDAPRAGGLADPRLVESGDGSYVLTYTGLVAGRATLMVACSPDLLHWTVEGAAFAGAAGGRYESVPTRNGAILTRRDAGKNRLVAAMIDEKYWMFWGEGAVHLASSQDLTHWTPLVDGTGGPVTVLESRTGRFDSAGAEIGPPPVLTPAGVVVLYRGRNAVGRRGGDKRWTAGAAAVGEALFDRDDPVRLVERSVDPVVKSAEADEKEGDSAGGLVWFGGSWLLY